MGPDDHHDGPAIGHARVFHVRDISASPYVRTVTFKVSSVRLVLNAIVLQKFNAEHGIYELSGEPDKLSTFRR